MFPWENFSAPCDSLSGNKRFACRSHSSIFFSVMVHDYIRRAKALRLFCSGARMTILKSSLSFSYSSWTSRIYEVILKDNWWSSSEWKRFIETVDLWFSLIDTKMIDISSQYGLLSLLWHNPRVRYIRLFFHESLEFNDFWSCEISWWFQVPSSNPREACTLNNLVHSIL